MMFIIPNRSDIRSLALRVAGKWLETKRRRALRWMRQRRLTHL